MTNEELPVFGIDLGTTNSCIARLSAATREPHVIPNSDAFLTTPSVVYFDAPDNIVVGKAAKHSAVARPQFVCSYVKREMSLEPQHVKKLTYHGNAYSPEAVSALILQKVVGDALKNEGLPERSPVRAVITVPAYFGTIGKNATVQAGKLAGIDVLYVAPEPVAAALAYAFKRVNEPQDILVYDLGGGTFDVTVVQTDGTFAKVIAFDGEKSLGGLNWDKDIVSWVRGQVLNDQGVELPTDDLILEQQLQEKAEEAKEALSRHKKALIAFGFQGKNYAFDLTVGKLEEITKANLETTIDKTVAVKKTAEEKLGKKIDRLLLVGGSSRMPAVARRLEEATGLKPDLHEPDLAVAKGAAVLAGLIASGNFKVDMTGQAEETAPESRVVTMLTPKSLGIEAHDRRTQRDIVRYLVPKNSALPAKGGATFGTYEDNQRHVNIRIFEERGEESEQPDQNTLLHESPVALPPGLRAGSPIEVDFRVDDAGVLHVFLKELGSGLTFEIKPDNFSKATDEDALRLKPALDAVV
jgi:molecular chaperone DnaK